MTDPTDEIDCFVSPAKCCEGFYKFFYVLYGSAVIGLSAWAAISLDHIAKSQGNISGRL